MGKLHRAGRPFYLLPPAEWETSAPGGFDRCAAGTVKGRRCKLPSAYPHGVLCTIHLRYFDLGSPTVTQISVVEAANALLEVNRKMRNAGQAK